MTRIVSLPFLFLLADNCYWLPSTSIRRKQIAEKVAVVASPDWPSFIPADAQELTHLLEMQEPIILLLQSVGLEVTEFFVTGGTQLDGRGLKFDRHTMQFSIADSSDFEIWPMISDEGIAIARAEGDLNFQTEGQDYANMLAVGFRFQPMGHFGETTIRILNETSSQFVTSENVGCALYYPQAAMDYSDLLTKMAEAIGAGTKFAQVGTARKMLIDRITNAYEPEERGGGLSGILYDPANWGYPQLLDETAAQLDLRRDLMNSAAKSLWLHIGSTKERLGAFLDLETSGFGPGDTPGGEGAPDLAHWVHNCERSAPSEFIGDADFESIPDDAPVLKTVDFQSWVEQINKHIALVDKELASEGPNMLDADSFASLTYSQFLTASYRYGALLPYRSYADIMLADDVGVNEFETEIVRQQQARMIAATYGVYDANDTALRNLKALRGFFAAVATQFPAESTRPSVLMAERALDELIANPDDINCLSLPVCFELINPALVYLDAVFRSAPLALSLDNILRRFFDGFGSVLMADDGETVRRLWQKHLQFGIFAGFLTPLFAVGVIAGAGKFLIDTLYQVGEFLGDVPGGISKFLEGLSLLFDKLQREGGTLEIVEMLGQAAGHWAIKNAKTLIAVQSSAGYAFECGRIAGPIVIQIILEMLFEAYIIAPLLSKMLTLTTTAARGSVDALRSALRLKLSGDKEILEAFMAGRHAIVTGRDINIPESAVLRQDGMTVRFEASDGSPVDRSADFDILEPSEPLVIDHYPDAATLRLDDPQPARIDLYDRNTPKLSQDQVPPRGVLSDDGFIETLSATLGQRASYLAEALPMGSSMRRRLVDALDTDPAATCRALDFIIDGAETEVIATRLIQTLTSTDDGAIMLQLMGQGTRPDFDALAQIRHIGGMRNTAIIDDVLEFIVLSEVSTPAMIARASALSETAYNRLLQKLFDAELMTARVAGDAERLPLVMQRWGERMSNDVDVRTLATIYDGRPKISEGILRRLPSSPRTSAERAASRAVGHQAEASREMYRSQEFLRRVGDTQIIDRRLIDEETFLRRFFYETSTDGAHMNPRYLGFDSELPEHIVPSISRANRSSFVMVERGMGILVDHYGDNVLYSVSWTDGFLANGLSRDVHKRVFAVTRNNEIVELLEAPVLQPHIYNWNTRATLNRRFGDDWSLHPERGVMY